MGAGRRAWGVYFPILAKLGKFFQVVAVCDSLAEHARQAGQELKAPAFTSLRELVKARPMEAVLAVTPPESHHAVSLFLSAHGVHHVSETPMACSLQQCRQMIEASRRNGVVLHVNEQFFRQTLIAFARRIIEAGVIGPIGRATWYHGHTGYHNNSIWQVLAGGRPRQVNAIRHVMPIRRHLDGAGRWQEREAFNLRLMHFESGLLVTDAAGNIKAAMGRYPRPGYLEIDGTEGAIVAQAYDDRPAPWTGRAEVRLVAPEDLERGAYAQSYPIERITMVGHRVNITERLEHDQEETWSLRCRLPDRVLEYVNPMLEHGIASGGLGSIAQCLLDFHRQVRQKAAAEFPLEFAIGSAEMESAFARSAELGGAPVNLPFDEPSRAEQQALAEQRKQFGVDPMDGEAMLDVAFPKNYDDRAWQPGSRC